MFTAGWHFNWQSKSEYEGCKWNVEEVVYILLDLFKELYSLLDVTLVKSSQSRQSSEFYGWLEAIKNEM